MNRNRMMEFYHMKMTPSMECPICNETKFLRELTYCTHKICMDCLTGIFFVCGQDKERYRCPFCRTQILQNEQVHTIVIPITESDNEEEEN